MEELLLLVRTRVAYCRRDFAFTGDVRHSEIKGAGIIYQLDAFRNVFINAGVYTRRDCFASGFRGA